MIEKVDYFGCGFHKPNFLSLDVLMIGMLDINEKRKNRGFIELYKTDGFSLFIKDENLVKDYIKKLLSTRILWSKVKASYGIIKEEQDCKAKSLR